MGQRFESLQKSTPKAELTADPQSPEVPTEAVPSTAWSQPRVCESSQEKWTDGPVSHAESLPIEVERNSQIRHLSAMSDRRVRPV